jgi:site-specific recombinase XerD
MSPLDLTPEQQERAQVLAEEALKAARADIRQMAELLASQSVGQLLGATEFQIQDLVHKVAARMIRAEIEHRQKAGAAKLV